MLTNRSPIAKDLVLVGGGHSHVEVLRRFGMKPLPGLRITLLTRDLHTPYSGMLPGLVAGIYDFDEAHVDLRPLCQYAGARLIHDEAMELDPSAQRIVCANRPSIDYDILSINIGSRQVTDAVPGVSQFATAVKPINRFMSAWQDIVERALSFPGSRKIAVVGGGAAGVEIILAMQRRLSELLTTEQRDPAEIQFCLVSKSARVLPSFPPGVSARFEKVLRNNSIEVLTGVEAVQAGSDRLGLSDGRELALDEILWVTEGGSQAWLKNSGIAVNDEGFVEVHETLQSVSHENIFAAGDIAHVVAHPRPKAGVIAVRQGPPLARNLRSALLKKRLRAFRPQSQMLALISTGNRYAIASRGRWHTQGRWVWRWKDWIDRRWMEKYRDFPDMQAQHADSEQLLLTDEGTDSVASNAAMRCLGCGAKVAPDILTKVLRDLAPVERPEVVSGIHSPDDAALVTNAEQGLSVHTVDHLSALVDDPYLFGKISATHALSDIYAMGAAPRTALAILTVPYSAPSKVESSVRDLMTGALEVLNAAETSLIGGHTSEGSELSLGFSINGHVEQQLALLKQSAEIGDAIVLTKPIG
ncbi:MAG: selenide, water dikinase SelD, partial [Pseudomonadota bacterium]